MVTLASGSNLREGSVRLDVANRLSAAVCLALPTTYNKSTGGQNANTLILLSCFRTQNEMPKEVQFQTRGRIISDTEFNGSTDIQQLIAYIAGAMVEQQKTPQNTNLYQWI